MEQSDDIDEDFIIRNEHHKIISYISRVDSIFNKMVQTSPCIEHA